MAKQTARKKKSENYWGVNIKIQSSERSGEKAYFDVFKKIFEDDIKGRVGGDKGATIRTMEAEKIEYKGSKYEVMHGYLTRYAILEGDNWYNEKTKKYEQRNTTDGLYPNGFDAKYVFIPAIHRLFIVCNSKFTLRIAYQYFNQALRKAINPTENFFLHVLQSQDSIDRIINAAELKDLYISVSYTNNDIGDKAQEAMDKLLKQDFVGSIDAHLKPDQTGKLNTDGELVRGLIELSKDNGEAKATIIDEHGKKAKVITSDFPEKIEVKIPPQQDATQILFNDMMNKYKNE
jgi:hypothetical protein